VFGPEEGYRGTVTARLSLRASCLVLLLGVGACTSQYVTRGAELYAGGFYIEAAEVFERTEQRLNQASAAEQAQYGLYRGATLLALGDSHRAQKWLRYSERLLQSNAALLSEQERDMLRRALGVLASHTPSEVAPPGGTAGTAMVER
jgi:tetratricopeptide (TPR) repeat protein